MGDDAPPSTLPLRATVSEPRRQPSSRSRSSDASRCASAHWTVSRLTSFLPRSSRRLVRSLQCSGVWVMNWRWDDPGIDHGSWGSTLKHCMGRGHPDSVVWLVRRYATGMPGLNEGARCGLELTAHGIQLCIHMMICRLTWWLQADRSLHPALLLTSLPRPAPQPLPAAATPAPACRAQTFATRSTQHVNVVLLGRSSNAAPCKHVLQAGASAYAKIS